MRTIQASLLAAVLLSPLLYPVPALADDDPETLVQSLRTTKDQDDLARVVDRVGDVGDADGASPAAVKQYLIEHATPHLVAIAENTAYKWSLRGSAIHALRDLRPPRAILQKVVDMALVDKDEYVKSRGEILQNYLTTLVDSEAGAVKPADAATEADAIAFLQTRNLGVSLDQLRLSAIDGKADEIEALLAAGVDPNAGEAGDAPLIRAMLRCSSDGESDVVVATVAALLKGGADVKRKDDNQNTPLMSAAQYCGRRVVEQLLAAGAELTPRNGSGITPLGMSILLSRWDASEALIEKGARLDATEAKMVTGYAVDERSTAIVKAASAKKK
ncbi:MAG TPA: ankyrin repeat domain-containing protein [Thermoanaerobaculia bacterium]|nr:ankyrin repeat domain-containing protein [Thermoanaerobaculia bacterium]